MALWLARCVLLRAVFAPASATEAHGALDAWHALVGPHLGPVQHAPAVAPRRLRTVKSHQESSRNQADGLGDKDDSWTGWPVIVSSIGVGVCCLCSIVSIIRYRRYRDRKNRITVLALEPEVEVRRCNTNTWTESDDKPRAKGTVCKLQMTASGGVEQVRSEKPVNGMRTSAIDAPNQPKIVERNFNSEDESLDEHYETLGLPVTASVTEVEDRFNELMASEVQESSPGVNSALSGSYYTIQKSMRSIGC